MCPTDLGRVAPLSVQPGTTEHTHAPACPKCHPQTIKRKGGRASFLAKLPRLTQSACAQCDVHVPSRQLLGRCGAPRVQARFMGLNDITGFSPSCKGDFTSC